MHPSSCSKMMAIGQSSHEGKFVGQSIVINLDTLGSQETDGGRRSVSILPGACGFFARPWPSWSCVHVIGWMPLSRMPLACYEKISTCDGPTGVVHAGIPSSR